MRRHVQMCAWGHHCWIAVRPNTQLQMQAGLKAMCISAGGWVSALRAVGSCGLWDSEGRAVLGIAGGRWPTHLPCQTVPSTAA